MSIDAAVILVGGIGSRLRPLSWEMPKPLMPIAGTPSIEHQLELLRGSGVARVILACGYGAAPFSEWAVARRGFFPFELEIQLEDEPLGTAGALARLKDRLQGRILVANGDTLLKFELEPMLTAHLHSGRGATLAMTYVEDASRYGAVRVVEDRLLGFTEKSPECVPGWVNAGVYLLEEERWGALPDRAPLSLEREIFPDWILGPRGFGVWPVSGFFLDIGTPESYLRAQNLAFGGELRPGPSQPLPAGVEASGDIWLGVNCRFGSDVQLRGPVVLGAGCEIGSGAVLDTCVLWEGVSVGPGSYIRSSVLGSRVRVEPSSRLIRCAAVAHVPLAPPGVEEQDRVLFF